MFNTVFSPRTGPLAQGALLPRTIKGASEAISAVLSDTHLTQATQDLYLQSQCEKHRQQNQALRQAAIKAGK